MSKYDLYLRDIKNKYTTNNQQNNLGLSDTEIDAQASKAVNDIQMNDIRKENLRKNLGLKATKITDETNQVSIDADKNQIQWANEYDEESLNWWEQVGAWIIKAKNTIAETFIKMGTENLVDAGALVGAMFADAIGDSNASENIRNFIKMDLTGDLIFNQEWYRTNPVLQPETLVFGDKASKYSYNDKATQDWVQNVAQGIGSSLGFAALTSIPYVGWGIAATSVGGASAEEALKEGANAEQAFGYGLTQAAVESASELLLMKFVNLIGKGGSKVANKIFGSKIGGRIANDAVAGIGQSYSKSIIVNLIKNFNEEGMEEVFSDVLNPIFKQIYKECDSNDFFGRYQELFNEQGGWNGLLESYFYGGLSAGVMEGANLGVRATRYQSIKAVQFENSLQNVVELNAELKEAIENNDITKYPNLQDNPEIQKILRQKEYLQEKIAKDFSEWLDNVKKQYDDKVNNFGKPSRALTRKAALVAKGQYEISKNTRTITNEIGKELVEQTGYKYKSTAKENYTDFNEQTVYVNGRQSFKDYVTTVMHETEHIANRGNTGLKTLTNAIVDGMDKTTYNKELKKQSRLQAKHFFETEEGAKWLKENYNISNDDYIALKDTDLKKFNAISDKAGKDNIAWFNEEVAAEHLVDSFKSIKEFKKVLEELDARGMRKVLNTLRKAFGSKKNKPKNYDNIVELLQDGIKESRKETQKPKPKKEKRILKFRETEDEFELTDKELKEIDDLIAQLEEFDDIEELDGYELTEDTKALAKEQVEESSVESEEFVWYLNASLSKEVKEYFKDSVVKSDNLSGWFTGTKDSKYLIPMFHGTPNSDMYFFDSRKVGTNGTARGAGFYLTNSYQLAQSFNDDGNGKIIVAFVNITNPLNDTKITISKDNLAKLINVLEENNAKFIDEYQWRKHPREKINTMEDAIASLFKNNTNDVELISDIYDSVFSNLGDDPFDRFYGKILKDTLGYDGAVFKNRAEGTIVIAFNSNQIKDVNNTAPTKSKDIRYREDSDGMDISDNVAKWNEGNKFVDEEGRILRLYHGSPMAGFMEFNERPIFLTPSYDIAMSYGGTEGIVNTINYSSADELINDFYNNEEDNFYQDLVKIADDEEAKEYVNRKIEAYKEAIKQYDDDRTKSFIQTNIERLEKALKEGYLASTEDVGDNTVYADERELLQQFQIDNQSNRTFDNLDDDMDMIEEPRGNTIYSLYAKATNPITINARGNNFLNVPFRGEKMRTDDIADIIKKEGKYDGIIFKNIMDNGALDYFNENGISVVYVVFNSNQVKATTNENPTESPDIRYREVDSEGNELSEEQQEFFANSKVRDDKGNLLVVYHGTQSTQDFNVFDKNRMGEATGGEKAFFFTNNEYVANEFSYVTVPSEIDDMFVHRTGEKGSVRSFHLNITNPVDFNNLTKKQLDIIATAFAERQNLTRKGEERYSWQTGYTDEEIKVERQKLKEFVIRQYNELKDINPRMFKESYFLFARQALIDAGYDGIIDRMYTEYEVNNNPKLKDAIEYAVFEPNQIKLSSTKKPTASEDIRYRETGEDNDFRRIQEESERLSDADIKLYRIGSKRLNEAELKRLQLVYARRINSSASSNNYKQSTLLNQKTNNNITIIKNIDAQTFYEIFKINKNYLQFGELVDLHEIEDTDEHGIGYKNTTNYLTNDGLSGFAITPDGDLISVFNLNTTERGFLSTIKNYVAKEGAVTLDAYNSVLQPLRQIYERTLGFKTTSLMDYNMKYDHDDIAENHNMPKVAFMVRSTRDIEVKNFDKEDYDGAKQWQLDNVDTLKRFRETESVFDNYNADNFTEQENEDYDSYLRNKKFENYDNRLLLSELSEAIIDGDEKASVELLRNIYDTVKNYHNELRKELSSETKDEAKIRDLYYNLENIVRFLVDSRYDFEDFETKAGKELYKELSPKIQVLARNTLLFKNQIKDLNIDLKETQKVVEENKEQEGALEQTYDETEKEELAKQLESEELTEDERKILKGRISKALTNVDLGKQKYVLKKMLDTKRLVNQLSAAKFFRQLGDKEAVTPNGIKQRYAKISDLILNIGNFEDYTGKLGITEEERKELIDVFLDFIYSTNYRKSRERKINDLVAAYNKLKARTEDTAPAKDKEAEKEKKIFLTTIRKLAMPEMAGIKAQADLRKDGMVYSLISVVEQIKLIDNYLTTTKALSDRKFKISFEGTTREFKALKIAEILNEYNNTQYVKNEYAINYSGLTNQQKTDMITDEIVNGITFDYNTKDSITNDKLSDYVKANDEFAIYVKEYIRNQIQSLVENEGEPSKVSKMLDKQAEYFNNEINKIQSKTNQLTERIVNLNNQLSAAKLEKNEDNIAKINNRLDRLEEEIENRKAKAKKLRAEITKANNQIRNLISKNEKLNASLEYYKRKNIELYTDSHGIVKIKADDVKKLVELGRNINPDFTMSNYVQNEIANAISKKNFDRAFDIYLNAVLDSEYVDGAEIRKFEDVVAMQETIFADEYREDGEPNHFLQDMEIIRQDLISIFKGSEISSKQKMLDRLAKLSTYNDNIKRKLRDTRNTFKRYKKAVSAIYTLKKVYNRFIEVNDKGISKSGNRLGGTAPEFVEMIRTFAKGTDDYKALNRLTPYDIINGNFKTSLKELYERWNYLESKGIINTALGEDLQLQIRFLLDPVNEINVGYIERYKKVLNGINHLVEEEIKLRQATFGDESKSLAEWSLQAQEENFNDDLDDLENFNFTQGFLTTKAVMEKLSQYNENSVIWKFYQELFKAEMKKEAVYLDLRSSFNEFEKIKGYKDFYKSLKKSIEIKYGTKTLKAAKGQLLSFYEAFKREQAAGHITNRFGGIEIDGVVTKFEDFTELESLVKAIEKEYDLTNTNSIDAKFLQASEQFFKKARKYKYDTDVIRLGYSNIEDGFYFPISIADSDSQRNITAENFWSASMPGAANYSWNKSTTGTMGAIKLIDIVDIIQRYMDQNANYAGYGVVTDNIKKVWNYKLAEGKTMAQAVKSRFNADSKQKVENYLARLLYDVQGINRNQASNVDNTVKKVINKLRGNVAAVALGVNPKVMFSQIASIPAAMRYIKGRYLVRALGSGFTSKNMPEIPDMLKYRRNTNQIAQAETQGAIQNANDVFSSALRAFDTFAINVIWKASLLQTRNSDGTYNISAATELAQKTVFDTQPNYITLGRSEFLRSSNDLVKMFTMFQSQAQQNLSMAYSAIEKIIYKKKHKIPVTLDDKKDLAKALIALLIQGLVYTGMSELFKHLVNNDWQDTNAKDESVKFGVDFFNDNIMGMIPIINNIELDLTSKTKINFNNLRVGYLDTFASMIQNFDDGITAQKINETIAYGFGIPTTNMYKWTKALAQYVPGVSDYVADIDTAYRGKKITKQAVSNASTKALTRTYYRQYTRKTINLDASTNSKLYSLYSKGYTSVIPYDIPETITYNGETIKVSKNDFMSVYGNLSSALQQMLNTSQFGGLNEELQAKVLTKLISLYYNASKKSITGENMNTLERLVYLNKNVDAKTLLAIVEASQIESDEKKTKKQNVEKYINSLRLTKANKYFIYNAIGYKVDSNLYRAYLVNLKLTRTQINMVVA